MKHTSVAVIVLLLSALICGAIKATETNFFSHSEESTPTLVFTKPDCVLVIYNGDSPRLGADAELLNKIKELGVKRVVTYPESYTPILVPEEEVANIKKLLGDRCLRISPKLE